MDQSNHPLQKVLRLRLLAGSAAEQPIGDLPPLPWDLDTTNPRLNIPLKVGELVTALHQWGHEVYAAAQLATTASNGSAPNVQPHPELTPIFLLNAALCIEGEGTAEKRAAIIEKLGRIANELHTASTEGAQAAPEEVREGYVQSATPGMGIVKIKVEGDVPEWLDPGAAVRVMPALRATTDKGEAA